MSEIKNKFPLEFKYDEDRRNRIVIHITSGVAWRLLKTHMEDDVLYVTCTVCDNHGDTQLNQFKKSWDACPAKGGLPTLFRKVEPYNLTWATEKFGWMEPNNDFIRNHPLTNMVIEEIPMILRSKIDYDIMNGCTHLVHLTYGFPTLFDYDALPVEQLCL